MSDSEAEVEVKGPEVEVRAIDTLWKVLAGPRSHTQGLTKDGLLLAGATGRGGGHVPGQQ